MSYHLPNEILEYIFDFVPFCQKLNYYFIFARKFNWNLEELKLENKIEKAIENFYIKKNILLEYISDDQEFIKNKLKTFKYSRDYILHLCTFKTPN